MEKGKNGSSYKTKKVIKNVLIHIMLGVLSFIWVFPVLWIIMTSLRGESNSTVPYFFPKEFTLRNFTRLFSETNVLNFPQMFLNTLLIAICSCLVSTIFVLCVSYCLSRLRFKFRKTFMNLAMIMGLFPGIMSIVAVYYILKFLGLTEGAYIRLALILVYSGGAGLGFYISKGFFDTIPRAIDEAAMIDGATKWEVFTKVTVPLSKPIIVFTVLTAFIGPWVDFIAAKVICRAEAKYFTVAIGLWNMLEKEYVNDWYTRFAAGAVCISVPIAILFVFLQRFYVSGMGGAVKG